MLDDHGEWDRKTDRRAKIRNKYNIVRDVLSLGIAVWLFYFAFIDRDRAYAKSVATIDDVSRMIKDDPEKRGMLTELRIMNETLKEIKADLRQKVDK